MATLDIMMLANLLRDVAKAEILPRFRHLDASMVKTKSEAIDLVTEADTRAEAAIKARIAQLHPDALFVGEESVAADPALLEQLAGAEFAIVVDPVDGTANFAAGLPLFAVMLAVVRAGETVAGIIYDPMGDDWVLAEKGGGAWLRRPDGSALRLHVAEPLPLSQMVGTVSMAFLPIESKPRIMSNLAKVRISANYRVAGHDYRLFAGGHTQFAMYIKLMPWDHLAGTLIATEAGGYVRRLDGSPYLPSHTEGGLLIATSPNAWADLSRELFNF